MDYDRLKELYIKEHKTLTQLGQMFGRSPQGIKYILDRFGVKTFSRKDRRDKKHKDLMERIDKIRNTTVGTPLTQVKLAKKLNISVITLRLHLRKG